MTKDRRPIIPVTMGDPAGIGPEIAVKSLLELEIYKICKPVLIGDLRLLEKTAKQLTLNVRFKTVRSPRDAEGVLSIIEAVDLKNVDLEKLETGKVSAEAGSASIEYVRRAVEYALSREAQAIVTAPINKKAVSLAGSSQIDHTELIASMSNVEKPLTMFWVRGARIFFLTRHMPLREAIQSVKKDQIVETTVKIDEELRKIGIAKPRIAVAALNPHASDEGLIGKEEETEISPAIKDLGEMGIDVYGPVPADSVFHEAVEGRYDAVLSLYHDQGHIAAKTLDFYGTVSVTLGLPFVRTSVDHGTAYEIAGKGVANPKSLREAIKLAAKLVTSQS